MSTFVRVCTKIVELIITILISALFSLLFVSPVIRLVFWLLGVALTDEVYYGTVGLSACILAVYYFAYEYKQNNPICPHGIKNGETKKLCPMCVRLAQEEKEEKERLAEITRKEEAERKAEQERKRRVQLQQEEYLQKQLSWQQFEDTIAQLFRELGYSVKQTTYSNDHGRDAIMVKDGKTYLLECKQYGLDKTVGRPQIQKFYAAIVEDKAVKGFFVNTGLFASTAYEYVKGKNIELINMTGLLELMKQVYNSSNQVSREDNEQIQFRYDKLDEEENPNICPCGIEDEKTKMLFDASRIVEEENKRSVDQRLANISRQKEEKKKIEREQQQKYELEIEDILKNQLDHEEFEKMVIYMFEHRGYKVVKTTDSKGKYKILIKNRLKYLLQYNQYRVKKCIDSKQLHKFYDAILEEKAIKGFFVNTGTFTPQAYEYVNVKSTGIDLIDMVMLVKLMK